MWKERAHTPPSRQLVPVELAAVLNLTPSVHVDTSICRAPHLYRVETLCWRRAGKGIELLRETAEHSAATIARQGLPALPKDILLAAVQEALSSRTGSVTFRDVLRYGNHPAHSEVC